MARSKYSPQERLTDILADITNLQKAGDLLHRVDMYLPTRRYEHITHPKQVAHPNALASLIDALQCALAMHEELFNLYARTGAYSYPEGYVENPESHKVWREVEAYFGFDDSE